MTHVKSTLSRSFSGVGFPGVIAWLFSWRASGCLAVHHDDVVSKVFFRDGWPCGSIVPLGFKPLGLLLLERGVIGLDALEISLAEVARTARPQGEVLVDLGHISPADLGHWLKVQHRERLRSLAPVEATYEFDSSPELPAWTAAMDLSPHVAVLSMMKVARSGGHVKEWLDLLDQRGLFIAPFEAGELFEFDEQETRLAASLFEAESLEEAVSRSGMDPATAAPVLAALACFGYLTPLDRPGPMKGEHRPVAQHEQAASLPRGELPQSLSEGVSPAARQEPAIERDELGWRPLYLLANGVARFETAEDVKNVVKHFLLNGALPLATTLPIEEPTEPFHLHLSVPGTDQLFSIECVLAARPEQGLALLRLIEPDAREIASTLMKAIGAQEATPAPAPETPESPRTAERVHREPADPSSPDDTQPEPVQPPPATAGSNGSAGRSIPTTGRLDTPTAFDLLEGFLDEPSAAGSAPEGVNPLDLVHSWEGLTRDVKVEIVPPGERAISLEVLGGVEVASSLPIPMLARTLARHGTTYQVAPLDEPSGYLKLQKLSILALATLKAIVWAFDEEALQESLGPRMALCPRLLPTGRRVAKSLSFAVAQDRLISRVFDGTRSVDELLEGGIGRKAAWECIYLLEMKGALEWRVPPEREREDPVQARWQAAQRRDHFEVLDLHWSSHPGSIPEAFKRLEGLYGPRGKLRGGDPDVADKLWRRIVQAKDELSDALRRQAYRKQRYRLDFRSQARVLVNQAKMALVRGDSKEARLLLEAALDVEPVEQARELLEQLGS